MPKDPMDIIIHFEKRLESLERAAVNNLRTMTIQLQSMDERISRLYAATGTLDGRVTNLEKE